MGEIKQGLKAGVDVSKYADPRFGLSRMALIRRGLEEGPDVSKYARNLKFDFGQLNVIWRGLSKGENVDLYANPKYSDSTMKAIRDSLRAGWTPAELGLEEPNAKITDSGIMQRARSLMRKKHSKEVREEYLAEREAQKAAAQEAPIE